MNFIIGDYGAKGDGITDDTYAVQKAIDLCHENGGGRVVCESGTYLCSSIVLKSNIDLHLEQGCTIISSLDGEKCGKEYKALITAKDSENISISGFGCIDGRSSLIFYDDNRDPLHEAPLDYSYGVFRPRTSFFENIRNITIKDITITNSVFWSLHFAGCTYVTVSGVKIFNNIRSNENDGIDPDCCKNVVISDCIITAGDDPIVIKTTKEMAEKYGSSENIVVNNCIFKTKSAGIKIGTETWADIKNITVSNCVIEECGRAFAIWTRDGAVVENINISNVRAVCRAYSACIDNKHIGAGYPYWWGKGEGIYISNGVRNHEDKRRGFIKNITISNMDIECESSVFISGSNMGDIQFVKICNCRVRLKQIGSQKPGWFDYRPSPKDVIKHSIPGLYIEFAKNIFCSNLWIEFEDDNEAYSEAIQVNNSENIFLKNVNCDSLYGKHDYIKCDQSKNVVFCDMLKNEI